MRPQGIIMHGYCTFDSQTVEPGCKVRKSKPPIGGRRLLITSNYQAMLPNPIKSVIEGLKYFGFPVVVVTGAD